MPCGFHLSIWAGEPAGRFFFFLHGLNDAFKAVTQRQQTARARCNEVDMQDIIPEYCKQVMLLMENQYNVHHLTSDAIFSLHQSDIRQRSAKELHDDCLYKRLTLYVYFVDQWYCPQQRYLWARSYSYPFASGEPIMIIETHWKALAEMLSFLPSNSSRYINMVLHSEACEWQTCRYHGKKYCSQNKICHRGYRSIVIVASSTAF